MTHNNGGEDEALRARLDKLGGALKAQRPQPSAPTPPPGAGAGSDAGSGMAMAMRAGGEFVAAILVGAAIGLGLDWALHTRPAFTILFFLLGVAAGVWNVIRATSPKAASFQRNSPLSGAKPGDKDVPRGAPSWGDEDED
jgi:F0F1-type ATP synthase assembly protein I